MSLKQKLSSRKLWATITGVIAGLSMVFGLDEATISTIAGAVVSVMSVMTYIITEGRIDAEGVKNAASSIQDSIDIIKGNTNDVVGGANAVTLPYKPTQR